MESVQIYGIDIGSYKSVVAQYSFGGVETQRSATGGISTPSSLAYGKPERLIGDSSCQQSKSNYQNTISSFNRYLGINKLAEEYIRNEQQYTNVVIDYFHEKQLIFNVTHRQSQIQVFPEQVYAAFLKKLKDQVMTNEFVVLGVPAYFSQVERQSVIDSIRISTVGVVSLMNEGTAVAVNYAYNRIQELQEVRNVVFTDWGHSKLTVTIVCFTKGKLRVLASVSDRNLGSREIDLFLMQRYSKKFQQSFGSDPLTVPRCRIRMMEAIEKVRITLSSNAEAQLSIECLLDDEDICETIKKKDYEEMVEGIISKRVTDVCEQALLQSGKYFLSGTNVWLGFQIDH